jgi:hypothetical protein
MGGGNPPGPRDGLNDPSAIDDGTLPRIGTPAPGIVGLDARSGGGGSSGAAIGDGVVSFARRRIGRRVGDGECFALADRALRDAGARSAADYGTVVPDADYVWGAQVGLAALQPGDIIQLRDYRYRREVVTESDDGTRTEERTEERSHHTAVVESVGADGAVTVLEQNSPEGSPVVRSQLYFAASRVTSGRRTTTVTVEGTFWFYRPRSR